MYYVKPDAKYIRSEYINKIKEKSLLIYNKFINFIKSSHLIYFAFNNIPEEIKKLRRNQERRFLIDDCAKTKNDNGN